MSSIKRCMIAKNTAEKRNERMKGNFRGFVGENERCTDPDGRIWGTTDVAVGQDAYKMAGVGGW